LLDLMVAGRPVARPQEAKRDAYVSNVKYNDSGDWYDALVI
jgi:hypothetical protein